MAWYPKAPEGPLELLENKNLVSEPFINKYWGAGLLGVTSFVGCLVANWYSSRPVLAGFQKHIGLSLVAAVVGHYIGEEAKSYYAERDAVLRHYVSLHEEEFPCFERKKYANVFEPWSPLR